MVLLIWQLDTIFGAWSSESRRAVKSVVEFRDGLLFYPLQYEGATQNAQWAVGLWGTKGLYFTTRNRANYTTTTIMEHMIEIHWPRAPRWIAFL